MRSGRSPSKLHFRTSALRRAHLPYGLQLRIHGVQLGGLRRVGRLGRGRDGIRLSVVQDYGESLDNQVRGGHSAPRNTRIHGVQLGG